MTVGKIVTELQEDASEQHEGISARKAIVGTIAIVEQVEHEGEAHLRQIAAPGDDQRGSAFHRSSQRNYSGYFAGLAFRPHSKRIWRCCIMYTTPHSISSQYSFAAVFFSTTTPNCPINVAVCLVSPNFVPHHGYRRGYTMRRLISICSAAVLRQSKGRELSDESHDEEALPPGKSLLHSTAAQSRPRAS